MRVGPVEGDTGVQPLAVRGRHREVAQFLGQARHQPFAIVGPVLALQLVLVDIGANEPVAVGERSVDRLGRSPLRVHVHLGDRLESVEDVFLKL